MTGGLTFDKRITLGNIIAACVMLAGFAGMWWNFSSEFATARSNITDLQDQVTPLPAIESRLTVVEVNQKNGADRGVQTQATLRDIQAQISLLLQQTAAINATLKDKP